MMSVGSESSGTISVRFNVNLAVAGGFTLTVQSDSGSAIEGDDFSSVDSQQVAFAGSANETQTLVLTVTNDTIIEANETLRIRISAVDPGLLHRLVILILATLQR